MDDRFWATFDMIFSLDCGQSVGIQDTLSETHDLDADPLSGPPSIACFIFFFLLPAVFNHVVSFSTFLIVGGFLFFCIHSVPVPHLSHYSPRFFTVRKHSLDYTPVFFPFISSQLHLHSTVFGFFFFFVYTIQLNDYHILAYSPLGQLD